jgi:hypothetical protein
MKKFIFLLFLVPVLSFRSPPINKVYNKKLYIPLVGTQFIETKMITKNKAKIKLEGIINRNGLAYYYNKNNKVNIKLSRELSLLMDEIKCTFSEPNYNYDKDEISFNLYIKPIYFNKKIILTKII